VANDSPSIVSAFRAIMGASRKDRKHPELWDGNAAKRIVQVMRGMKAPLAGGRTP